MSNKNLILRTLDQQPGNICDDCLTTIAHLKQRQIAFIECKSLAEQGAIHRDRSVCVNCGKTKNVSRSLIIADTNPTITPMISVEPGIVPSSCVLSDLPQPWYWEGNVQSMLIAHLVTCGYSIRSVADTAARTAGKDIIALTPAGKELWISVKGYPDKSSHTQARHWFAGAIFDLVLYRDENPDVQLALAFPDGFITYQGLAGRISWLRKALPFTIFWITVSGSVRIE